MANKSAVTTASLMAPDIKLIEKLKRAVYGEFGPVSNTFIIRLALKCFAENKGVKA
jgi:hypothetical protein